MRITFSISQPQSPLEPPGRNKVIPFISGFPIHGEGFCSDDLRSSLTKVNAIKKSGDG